MYDDMIEVRFMTLSGPFATAKVEKFATVTEATRAVEAYALASGYSGVKLVDGRDEGLRWTAKTPGGRSGRNVAFADV